jgi:hypothetical protein
VVFELEGAAVKAVCGRVSWCDSFVLGIAFIEWLGWEDDVRRDDGSFAYLDSSRSLMKSTLSLFSALLRFRCWFTFQPRI